MGIVEEPSALAMLRAVTEAHPLFPVNVKAASIMASLVKNAFCVIRFSYNYSY
jgi:hypothetical protein